jgi:glycosyltransferase involved in cell wall biosynthesis
MYIGVRRYPKERSRMNERSDRTTVSVVIPTYNRANDLVRAVKSVLGQTRPPDEIIVVDDGSTDDTGAKIETFDGRVVYIRQENRGPGAARNRGIAAAHGEWIAFLDSDDRWLPEKLETQLHLTLETGYPVSFHDFRKEAPNDSAASVSWNRHVSEQVLRLPPLPTGRVDRFYELVTRFASFFLPSTMLVRRDVLETLGCFDPSFRTSQDVELFMRIAPRYDVLFIDRVLSEYLPGTDRAFEVASRISGRKTEKGVSRIVLDRIRALEKSFLERCAENDRAAADIARAGLIGQLRSLASRHLRAGFIGSAVLVYARIVATAVVPDRLLRVWLERNRRTNEPPAGRRRVTV